MQKRFWSALQHSVCCSLEPDISGESSLCVAYPLLFCLSHFPLQCNCLHFLYAFCGLYLLSVVLVGHRQASLKGCAHWESWKCSGS